MRLLITVVYCLIVIHGSSSVPGPTKKQEESFSSAQALGQGIPMKNEDIEDAYGQIADKGNQLILLTNVKSQEVIHNSPINPLQKNTGIGNYHSNVLKNRLKTNENSNENTDYSVSRETNHNGVIDDSLNNGPGTEEVVHSRSKREIKKTKKTASTYRYESEPIKSRFSYIQKIQKLNEQKEVAGHKIVNEHKKIVIENHSALEEHNSEETHEHHSRTTSQFKVTKKKRKVKRKRGPLGTKDDSEEYEDDESTEEESAEIDGSSKKIGSSNATDAESTANNNSFKGKSVVQPHVSTVAIRNLTKNTTEETENKTKTNKIMVEKKQVSGQTVAVLKKKDKSLEEVNESKDLPSDERSKTKTEKVGNRQRSSNADLLYKGKASQSSFEARKSMNVLKSNTQSENLFNFSKSSKQLSRQNVLSAEKNLKSVFKNKLGIQEKNSQVQTAAATLKNNLSDNKYTNINTNNDYGERIVKVPNAAQKLIPSVKQQVTESKNPIRDRGIYNKPVSSSMGLFYERNLKKSEDEESEVNNEFEMDRWRLKVPKATVGPHSVPKLQNVPTVQKSITASRNQAVDESSELSEMRQSKRVENRINAPRVQRPIPPKDPAEVSTGPESTIIRDSGRISPLVPSTGRTQTFSRAKDKKPATTNDMLYPTVGLEDINTEINNSFKKYNKNKSNVEINRNVETDDKNTIIKVSKERENFYSVPAATVKPANVLKSMRPNQIRPKVAPLQRAVNMEPKVGEKNPAIYQSPEVNADQPDLRRDWQPPLIRVPTFKRFQNMDSSTSGIVNFNSRLSTDLYNVEHKENIETTAQESEVGFRNFAKNNPDNLRSPKIATPQRGDDRFMRPKSATISSSRELHDANFIDLQNEMSEINRNYQINNRESIFKLPKVIRNPFYLPFGPNLSNNFQTTAKKSKAVPSSPFRPGVGNLPAGTRSPMPTVNRPIISSDSIVTRKPRLERPRNKEGLLLTEKSDDSNTNTKEKSNDDIDNNKAFTVKANTSPVRNLPKLSQYISDFQRSITNFNNRLQQSMAQKISKINSVSTSMDNFNGHDSDGINSEVNIFANKHLNQPKTIGNLPFVSNLFAEKNSQEIKENMDSLFEKYGWRNSRKVTNEEGNQSTIRKVAPVTNNLPYATRSPFRNWPVFAPLPTPTRMQKIGESKTRAVSTSMLESNDNREEYFRKGDFKNSEKRTEQIDATAETDFNLIKNLKADQAPLRPFNRVNAPSKPNERYGLNSEENKREDIRQSSQKELIKSTTSQKSLSTDLIKYSTELNEKLDAFLNQHQQALNNFRSVLKLPAVSDNLPEVTSLPSQITTIKNPNLTRLKTNAATTSMVESKNTEEEYIRRAEVRNLKKDSTEIDNTNVPNIRSQNSIKYLPTVPNVPKIAGNLPAISIPQRRFENNPSNARLRPLITEDPKPQKPKSQAAPTIDSKRYSSKTNIFDSSIPQVPAVTDYRPEFTRPFLKGYNPRFNTEPVPRMQNPARNLPSFKLKPKGPENISATPKIPTTQMNRVFDFPLQDSPARLPKLSNPNRELPGNVHSAQKVPVVADYRPEVTRSPMTFEKLPFFAPLQTSPFRTTQLGFDRPENKFASLNTENTSKNINSHKNRYGTEDYDSTKAYFNRPHVEGNFPTGRKITKVADNLPEVTGLPKTFKNGPFFFSPEKSAIGVPKIKGDPSTTNFAYNTPESFRVSNISQSEQASFASKPHAMQENRSVFYPPQPLQRVPKFHVPSVPNIYHGWPNMERHVPGVEDDTEPSLNIPNFGRNLAPVSQVPKLAGNIQYFPRTPTPIGHWPVLVPPQSSPAILPKFRKPNAVVVTPPAGVYYPHALIPTEHGSGNFLNVPEKMRGFLPFPNSPTVKGNLRNIPNSPFTLYNQPHTALFPSRLPKVPKFHRIENGIIPMPHMFPYNINIGPNVPSIIGRVQPFHTVPSYYYPHNLNAPMVVGRIRPPPKLSLIRNHQKIPMINKPHLVVGSPFPKNIYPVPKLSLVRKPQVLSIPSSPAMNGFSKNRYFPSPKKHTEGEQETLGVVALGKRAGQTIWGIPVSNAAGKIEYLTVGNQEGDMNLITSTDITGRAKYLYRIRDETGRYHNLHLKPTGGHLSLVESDYFGGKHLTGFIGYDETGEYIVPVHFEGNHHLVIDPYARSLRYAVDVHPAHEIVNEFFKYKK